MGSEDTNTTQRKQIMTNETVANIILQQIGQRALDMMGARDLMDGGDSVIFRIGKNAKKISKIAIVYDKGWDHYDITFFTGRGVTLESVKELVGVYADSFHQVIEMNTGLALSL